MIRILDETKNIYDICGISGAPINAARQECNFFLDENWEKLKGLKGTTNCIVIEFRKDQFKEWPTRAEYNDDVSKMRIVTYRIKDFRKHLVSMSGTKSKYTPRCTYLGEGKYAIWWKLKKAFKKRLREERANEV